ncbi:hypothetical protein EV182_007322 [Spiromyces aspiralis]|uniref:Uncharacterized protein n=1 Tax=Spiromyces aspiralis TaxID=68401 RepID=A0ACC1HKA5_9FUNG|nr:hypothetical protein EV182_007322 [Spiromyces aspiralis]
MQIIDPRKQRVGMLGMAGIHHGPLASLQNSVVVKYIEADAARELFEFMDPASEVSQTYLASLGSIMQRGVRVICVGSWIDEVVPLYSAVFHGISHPNLYRAVYIDGPHYRDDFLTNLIIFALRLRNGGVDDKGLLVHLSNVIVGTLWGSTSGGHSTIYEEKAVYKLALRWLFYSTIVSKPIIISSSLNSPSVIAPIIKTAQSLLFRVSPDLSALRPCGEDGAAESLHIQYRPLNGSDKLNPFYLPWILHSLWCDSSIKGNPVWRRDIEKLIQLYDEWEPTTKAGKDLKYQLEAIRLCI